MGLFGALSDYPLFPDQNQGLMTVPNTIGAPLPNASAVSPAPQTAPQQMSQNFGFKPVSKLALITGGIGDALQQAGGGHATFLPVIQQQREQQRAMQMSIAQEQYKNALEYQKAAALHHLDVTDPTQTDVQKNYGFIGQQQGPQAATSYLSNVGDPPVTTTLPNGMVYSGSRSGLAPWLKANGYNVGGAAPSVPTVSDQKSYDAVPAGGQFMDPSGHIRTKGGQMPQASGGFR